MFNAIDKNHDELLSHSELKKYLQNCEWGKTWVKENGIHWKELFSKYDADNDGSIGNSEFLSFYRDNLAILVTASPGDIPLEGEGGGEEAGGPNAESYISSLETALHATEVHL